MNDSMKEFSPRQEAPSINAVNASVDLTVSNRFKKLIPEKGRRVTKLAWQRTTLTASALTILLSSGCGNINTANLGPGPVPIPTSIPVPEEHSFQEDIVLNGEGLPVGYLLENGTMNPFNMENVKKIRQAAIDSGESQILAMFPAENKSYTYNVYHPPSSNFVKEKHPVLSNLPEDVLSEKELAVNGVKIIQADNTKLHIRKQAFEDGGPLVELVGKGGSETLTIVMADISFLSRNLLNDKRYDEVRNMVPDYSKKSIQEYRQAIIIKIQDKLKSIRERFSGDELSFWLLVFGAQLYAYEKGIVTDEQILMQKLSESPEAAAGLYYQNSLNNRTIFICAGQEKTERVMDVVYFDPKGKVSLRIDSFGSYERSTPWGRFTPNLYQSYPDPNDFGVNPNASPDDPKSYPYGAQSAGQILRHEIKHDEGIAQAISRGHLPDFSEYNTDMAAMQGIRDAWEKWEKSGYTDNSGYYFVFSLPEGGYILTKAQDKFTKTVGKA